MLGLSRNDSQIAQTMITTADVLVGFEVTHMMGTVEAVVEKSFKAMSVGGFGIVSGGELAEMIFDAKEQLARAASDKGADAIIVFRYAVTSRELEKSVVAYGTAVKCHRRES
jgi:uncharacterized protein YbjQ (UPF0145 family)